MRRALVFEIEELLFDTGAVRAGMLRDALAHEGAQIAADVVAAAHSGVPAALALQRLGSVLVLDVTGRDLVLHRAAALTSREFEAHAPAFDIAVRDQLAALAVDVSLAVVTRATSEQARRWLAAAGLDACVGTVRSLADVEPAEYAAVWSEALGRAHATQGVAIAAPPLLPHAASAGLRTVHIGEAADRDGTGYHPDAQLSSLSQLHSDLIASLCPAPHVIHPAP